jgi:TolB-like protein/Tfp pilus assembly protein PilF
LAEGRIQRKLAAILVADVVGFSRLMGSDEEGTLARLKKLRSELFDPTNRKNGGRIVKTTGDGALVEFSSAVDAVRNAIEIQRALADQSEANPIRLRIGINVGDVIVEGDDIYGEGVNVAARLEALAEPGGICISGTVFDQIGNKLDLAVDDLGPQSVKNIAEPIRTYRVHVDGARPVPEAGPDPLPLPDKPSIAVLAFENMSGDPEQEYFADGIAEDIITALSRFGWFFVIARNSSFSYKGEAVDVQRISRELGVQYVLEGSVRKAGNRVRITAQLIDATTGNHIWAERYDRELEDIFAVQDEITSTIAGAVAPSFVGAEARRIERKAPKNLHAWDYAIRGNWNLWHLDMEHLAEARRLFEAAIDLDRKNVLALSGMALACSWQVVWGWAEDPDAMRELADEMAQRAVAADEHDAWAQASLSTVHLHRRRLDAAARAALRAIELNPNLAVAEFTYGAAMAWKGDYEATREHTDKAVRLSPRDPAHAWFMLNRVVVAFVDGRYEEQVERAEKMTEAAPDHPGGWRMLAAGNGLLGRKTEAEAAVKGLLRVVPHMNLELCRASVTGIREQDLERLLEGLRKAGLPP